MFTTAGFLSQPPMRTGRPVPLRGLAALAAAAALAACPVHADAGYGKP